jgi:hypothetical protein
VFGVNALPSRVYGVEMLQRVESDWLNRLTLRSRNRTKRTIDRGSAVVWPW